MGHVVRNRAILAFLCVAATGCSQAPSSAIPAAASTSAHQSAGRAAVPAFSSVIFGVNGETGPDGGIREFTPQGDPIATSGNFPNSNLSPALTYDSHDKLVYVQNDATAITQCKVTAYTIQGVQESLTGAFAHMGFCSTPLIFDVRNDRIYSAGTHGKGERATLNAYDEQGRPIFTKDLPAGIRFVNGGTFDSRNGLIYINVSKGIDLPPEVLAYDERGDLHALPGAFSQTGFAFSSMVYDSHSDRIYVVDNIEQYDCCVYQWILAYTPDGNPVTLSPGFRNTKASSWSGIAYDPGTNQIYLMTTETAISAWDENGNPVQTSGNFGGHKFIPLYITAGD